MTARDIIVVGASLGGLDALSKLLGGLPGELNAAVLIVLHTSPQSPGLLAAILGQRTPLKVAYGQHGRSVERGHVYIAPPDHHLTVSPPGVVHLDQRAKVRFSRPAADPLFRSAADVYGPRVIGVVLTGCDGDGTEGLRAIKAAGGISVVQDPKEAVAPDMPRRAIIGDSPDFIVVLSEMAPLLVQLVTVQRSNGGVGRTIKLSVMTGSPARGLIQIATVEKLLHRNAPRVPCWRHNARARPYSAD